MSPSGGGTACTGGPGGWTVRQTVHHIADSHANSLIRFKLALTEDEPPTIRPYYEDRWAELGDNKLPIGVSLNTEKTRIVTITDDHAVFAFLGFEFRGCRARRP